MICSTICLFVFTITWCRLEDINLVAGGWGQSSAWLKGRFQINGAGVKIGGVEPLLAYEINASVTLWWWR